MPITDQPHRRREQTEQAHASPVWRLPEWLPPPIANFVGPTLLDLENGTTRRSLKQFAKDPNVKAMLLEMKRRAHVLRLRLRRLTTDSRMKFVWHRLERERRSVAGPKGEYPACPDHITDVVDAYLRGYLHMALGADTGAAYWARAPSGQEQREIMRQIHHHARALQKLLGESSDHDHWTPWDALSAAIYSPRVAGSMVNRSLDRMFRYLARQTYGRHWSSEQPAGSRFPQKLHADTSIPPYPEAAQALLSDLPSQLRGLRLVSKLSIVKNRKVQTKQPYKTEQLRQTVYVRALARFVASQGLRPRKKEARQAGFPLHEIIAITANVALPLSGSDALTPDMVRQIVKKRR